MDETKKQDIEETIGLLVHSYNNFLAGVIGFNELAELECKQPEVAEKLTLSMESAQNAVDFGKQLLSAVARLQVALVPTELSKILNDFASINQIAFSLPDNLNKIKIKTDREWFKRCLFILVDFCQNYAEQQTLNFVVSQKQQHAVICVNSPTIKFSTQQQARLFEPFYSSRTLLGGKDVGLAVAHGFFRQMKGKLSWNEEEGFVVSIPLYQD